MTRSARAVEQSLAAWDSRWIRAFRARGGATLWLEYFAGHFNTSDGEYNAPFVSHVAPSTGYPCVPLSAQGVAMARANPRHAASSRFAHRAGWALVPTFDEAVPHHDEHPGVAYRSGFGFMADCRHWCSDSGVLVRRMRTLLAVM